MAPDGSALDDIFFALSAPLRRAVLNRLQQGSATVQQIAEPFDVSLNTVSKHLKILERADLIRRDIRGREHHCSLNPAPLELAGAFLGRYGAFWTKRLEAMESMLDEERPS